MGRLDCGDVNGSTPTDPATVATLTVLKNREAGVAGVLVLRIKPNITPINEPNTRPSSEVQVRVRSTSFARGTGMPSARNNG